MTLATRCPACGTIFRVVQDQLRVSQGWVRCGRCGEAFNAVEAMVDLPPPRVPMPVAVGDKHPPEPAAASVSTMATLPPSPPAPPPEPSPQREPESPQVPVPLPASVPPPEPELRPLPVPALAAAPEPEPERPDTVLSSGLGLDVSLAAVPAESTATLAMIELPPGVQLIASDGAIGETADVPRQPAIMEADVAAAEADAEPAPPPPLEPSLAVAAVPAAPAPQAASEAERTPAATAAEPQAVPLGDGHQLRAIEEPPPAAPSFIVKAERAERWRRPGVRAALSVAVLLSAAALAAQAAYVYRDHVAAVAPQLKPLLQQACATLDCRVGDVRQIESLSVESSALVRVEGSQVYRLSVTLRNRSAIEIAAPALDVSLTDAQGRPIARRALTMADLQLPLRTLKAGTELPIQVPLGIADRQVSGYTVEIFYP